MLAERRQDEEARLAALRRYHILDTPHEMEFEELAQHIAHVCDTPIALISLIDEDRQWFKAQVGLGSIRQTTLEGSICAHNILHADLLVVPDLLRDRRFAEGPLVAELGLRFYAGCPLETPDGFPIGALCVLDYQSREITEKQTFALRTIAHQVMIQLELRRVLEECRGAQQLQRDRDFLSAILDSAGDAIVACDENGVLRLFNRAAVELHGVGNEPLEAAQWPERYDLYLADGKTPMPPEKVPLLRALREGSIHGEEMVIARKGHPPRSLLATGRAVTDAEGNNVGAVVVMHDITYRKQAEAERLQHVAARAAREAAEKSERKVVQILESITDAFFFLDDQWRFTYVNQQAEALLRRDRGSLLGRVVWEEYPEAVGSQFEREYRRAVAEKITAKFESFFPPLDTWFQVTAYPSAEGLSVYFADISERKRAEHALQEEERRFRAVFNLQFQFMAIISPDGRVVDINNLTLETTGFPRSEVVDRPLWDNPLWRNLSGVKGKWRNLLETAARENRRVTAEVEFETATGARRAADAAVTPVKDEQGSLLFFIAEGKDITERTVAEQKLRESEERFRTLVQQVKDYAIFMTDPAGRATSWNEGVERILNFDQKSFIGLDTTLLFTPEDIASGVPEQELNEAAVSGTASNDRWMMRNGGARFWASGMTTAVRGPDGKLVGFAKVFRDLTEQKRIQDQLAEAQQQLREYAGQLEARVEERTAKLQETISELEAFSYSVSHDLRAPLRAMQGYSQFLLEDYGATLDETARGYIDRIRNAASRLDQLIQDILTYSRVARAQIAIQPVDLEKLVHEVMQAYPGLQPPKAEVNIRSPLLRVMAHEPSMMQCISNLLGNAVKFVPPDRVPRVSIWTEPRDGRVRIWFEDNGIGIPAEHQQRIFRMFEVAHRGGYEGTGIGLAIVRKAVERMGGTVGVESEMGKGSRFWIELSQG